MSAFVPARASAFKTEAGTVSFFRQIERVSNRMYNLNTIQISAVNGADGSCLQNPPNGSHDDWESGTKNVLTGIYDGLVDAAEYVMEKVDQSRSVWIELA